MGDAGAKEMQQKTDWRRRKRSYRVGRLVPWRVRPRAGLGRKFCGRHLGRNNQGWELPGILFRAAGLCPLRLLFSFRLA